MFGNVKSFESHFINNIFIYLLVDLFVVFRLEYYAQILLKNFLDY